MTACSQCGATVKWVKDGQRWKCLNPDGSDHWDLCSKNRWGRVKREGKHFTEKRGRETVKGYDHATLGTKLYSMEGMVVKGPLYKPVKHRRGCNVPPWEDCACDIKSTK